MTTPLALYLASVLGAAALLLAMPRRGRPLVPLGTLLGPFLAATTLGLLWLLLAKDWLTTGDTGLEPLGFAYYYVFGGISLLAAGRVITHPKPVYSALWFILVVVSSAGLMITLSAEFMALAMLIIYGGAILVTYMFVIMLASQSAPLDSAEALPDYDGSAREPVAAVAAGFLLLAVLLGVAFDPSIERNPDAAVPAAEVAALLPERTAQGESSWLTSTPTDPTSAEAAAQAVEVSNVERIGVDLFTGNPLAIELAGVILLMAMIGAVVIAKAQPPSRSDDSGGMGAGPGAAPGANPADAPPSADPLRAEPPEIGAMSAVESPA
ncbi:MAG: NADH-quinone oxidoreductase subunit J [Planctomycetota bacterium]